MRFLPLASSPLPLFAVLSLVACGTTTPPVEPDPILPQPTAPAAPASATAAPANRSATVHWQAPSDDGGSP